jgi:hypothetical protein
LTKDRATGQPVRPCLISVSAPTELFATFVLPDLDPVACLHSLVSQHPYDLEAVRPVVDFEILLSQYKFVEGMDAIAGLCSFHEQGDGRPVLRTEVRANNKAFEHRARLSVSHSGPPNMGQMRDPLSDVNQRSRSLTPCVYNMEARSAVFRQGLKRLGWSEDRNIYIDTRFAPAGAGQEQLRAKSCSWRRNLAIVRVEVVAERWRVRPRRRVRRFADASRGLPRPVGRPDRPKACKADQFSGG